MIFLSVFGRISMLGLIVFKVLASSFLRRQWEISLCCFHPFGYDLVSSCALFVIICHMRIHVLIKCSLLRFGGGGGRYRCVAATLLNMI